MRTLLAAAAIAVASSVAGAGTSAAPLQAPYALTAEHAELDAELRAVAAMPGPIGEAARAAADLVTPHVALEERLVLPLLGLAPALVEGAPVAEAEDALARTAALKADLPRIMEAYPQMVSALTDLFAAAEAEGRPEISRLADRMIRHAIGDIEVSYPAAIVIGDRLGARLAAERRNES